MERPQFNYTVSYVHSEITIGNYFDFDVEIRKIIDFGKKSLKNDNQYIHFVIDSMKESVIRKCANIKNLKRTDFKTSSILMELFLA